MVSRFNIANVITFGRLALGVPILGAIYLENRTVSITMYLLFLLMDIMDGWCARRFKCETKLGKNLDFTVDGLVGSAVLLMLLYKGLVPWAYMVLVAIPMIVKSVFIWRSTRLTKGTFQPAEWSKLNGAMLFLIPLAFMTEHVVGMGIAYVLLVYVYVSSVKYIFEIQNQMRRRKKTATKKRKKR